MINKLTRRRICLLRMKLVIAVAYDTGSNYSMRFTRLLNTEIPHTNCQPVNRLSTHMELKAPFMTGSRR